MRVRLSLSAGALAASLLIAGVCLAAGVAPAAAQGLIFDWGDNDKTVDSGKAHVRFNGGGKAGDIIVSFGDRKLYHIVGPGEADTYPIAIPREQSRWEGVTTVSMKRENPSWTPTPHMLAENPKLPRWVPGGHPMNPLGNRAMYLGSSDYRIHGTDAPWTIGTPASKGCVRMFNKDVADLYPLVKVGAKVTVTWQKFDGKTLAMAGHEPAKGIVEPDAKTGKASLASYEPQTATSEPQSKSPVQVSARPDDYEAAVEARSAAAVPQAEFAVKQRKPKPRPLEATEPPADQAQTAANKDKAETAAATPPASEPAPAIELAVKKRKHKPRPPEATEPPADQAQTAANKDKAETAAATPTASEPAPGRSPRRARSHQKLPADQGFETGSIAKPAVETRDDSAAMALAERAMAAAERAAQAAERAAAAAERAVAASQNHAAAAPAAGEVSAH